MVSPRKGIDEMTITLAPEAETVVTET